MIVSDKRTPFDLIAISHHEAGHGVVAALLGAKVESLDIELAPDRWGLITYRRRPVNDVPRIAIKVAGYVAELRAAGKVHTDIDHSAPDIIDVMRLLRERHGENAAIDSPEHRDGILLAEQLIRRHWTAVRHVARRLRANRRLTGPEFRQIFNQHKREKHATRLEPSMGRTARRRNDVSHTPRSILVGANGR